MLSRVVGLRALSLLRIVPTAQAGALSLTRVQPAWTRSMVMTRPVLAAKAKVVKETPTAKATKKSTTSSPAKKADPKKTAGVKAAGKTEPKQKKEVKPKRVKLDIPKRAPSAFNIFMSKFRKGLPKVEGEGGFAASQRAMKEAAQVWKNMSEEERKPFFDEHEITRVQRTKEFEDYMKTIDEDTLRAFNRQQVAKGKSRKLRPGHEKRPASAYSLFASELIKEGYKQGKVFADLSREAGAKWKTLSDAEKNVWYTAWEKAIAEFDATHGPAAA